MSTVADYVGRTVDLAAFWGAAPGKGDTLLTQALVVPGNGGGLVTGIQKLAQRFIITLLTELGTKIGFPLDGTAFMADGRLGRWRTVADVEQSFYAALIDVRRQVQTGEATTDPDDERYAFADLNSVHLSGDSVSIQVTLVSLANRAFTFITPITVSIR